MTSRPGKSSERSRYCPNRSANLANRTPREWADGEVIDLGGKRVRRMDTPHVLHGWDAGAMLTTSSHLEFGMNNSGWNYAGQIAEVLIYNRALTDAERAQIASALSAKYNLNDTDSDGLPDAWEQQYFGTLSYGPNDDPGGVGFGQGPGNVQ